LDPAAWPDRAQAPILASLAGVALVASLIWPAPTGRFFWLLVPFIGALIWRMERTPWRVIASWTIPLGFGLLVAERLPSPLDTLASVLGLGVLVAMMFWDKARDGWVHLVAPGSYRAFSGPDRKIAERLMILDSEAVAAIESFTRDGNDLRLRKRLDSVSDKARGLSIADAEWLRVRDQFLDWLAACSGIARHPAADSETFEDMDRRRGIFEASKAALEDARSHLV
jgi:hypothetical protein